MVKISKTLKDKKGFTLIELIVVLSVIATLAAALTPMIISYVEDAKSITAKADVKTIAEAILAFNKDMHEWPIWESGTQTKAGDTKYTVLYSEEGDKDVSCDVPWSTDEDTIDDQLITNDPNYPLTGAKEWKGPYITNLGADPWGNRYYVDVYALGPVGPQVKNYAAFVVSGGPDGVIETKDRQKRKGFTIGGDDIVRRIK